MPSPRSKTVLIIDNFASSWAGTCTAGEDLAEQLPAAAWRVITASTRQSRAARLADMLATAARFRHEYSVAQIDVYSGRPFIWAEAVTELLHALGKPFVVTLHGADLPHFARRNPFRVRRVLRRAAVVVAPSRFMAAVARPLGVRAHVIPNAIRLERYPFRERAVVAPRLVWLRRVAWQHNPAMAVNVLAALRDEFPDATLTMVGGNAEDGAMDELRAAAARGGVGAALRLTPGVAKRHVPACLAQGDVFLNTSSTDNMPVSIIEALASGLPVVSTNVGGIPALLQHEVDGLLTPESDADSMAAAVRRILTEPDLARTLSRGGRTHAENFDWRRVLPRWDALLTAVATRGTGAAFFPAAAVMNQSA